MKRSLAVIAPLLLLLSSPRAQAYGWMIRHGYTSCAVCHVDPSGAGNLTPYGRAQGEILLQSHYSGGPPEEASRAAGFLWGALTSPDWLEAGGDLRAGVVGVKVGSAAVTNDLILMQADLSATVSLGHFRFDASIGAVSTNGSRASVAGNLVSREQWVGYSFDDDSMLIRAGRINVPFGLRTIDHTVFVRQATRTDINDTQEDGVTFAYTGESWHGEVMAIAGNYQVSPDGYRERGYSGYLEYSPASKLSVGVSSLVTYAAKDIELNVSNLRQAHGVFARWSPWTPLVLMVEADLVVQGTSSIPSETGAATMLQADYEVWQGLHLIGIAESYSPGVDGTSYGGWLAVAWFFGPHMDVRFDVLDRSQTAGPSRLNVLSYVGQAHVYF